MWTNLPSQKIGDGVMKEICDLPAVKNAWLVRV